MTSEEINQHLTGEPDSIPYNYHTGRSHQQASPLLGYNWPGETSDLAEHQYEEPFIGVATLKDLHKWPHEGGNVASKFTGKRPVPAPRSHPTLCVAPTKSQGLVCNPKIRPQSDYQNRNIPPYGEEVHSYTEIEPTSDKSLQVHKELSNLASGFRRPLPPSSAVATTKQPPRMADAEIHTIVQINLDQLLPQLQPKALASAASADEEHDWLTPLCGCFSDAESCCAGFFCPCFYTCHVAREINEDCCVGCCTPCALVSMRAKVRTQENIKGSICLDTALHMFCYCCELTQLAREVMAIKKKKEEFHLKNQNVSTMTYHSIQGQNIIVMSQPQVVTHAMDELDKREWSTGLCECFIDFGPCCASFFCPLCYTCYLAVSMDEHCCIGVFTPGALIAMRTKIRAREKIRGGICLDTCKFIFCHCCAISQLGREVKIVKARGGRL